MSGIRGALLLNKPKGLTSHDVVYKIRRIFKIKEVGHAGTLDPMAQGLLVILLGEATKLSNYITSQDKTYLATLDLGYTTTTLDSEGEIVSQTPVVDLAESQIVEQAHALVGDLCLNVPLYSAVKMQGKKLYDYARSGQVVDVPKRNMRFYSSQVIESQPQQIKVRLACEKGAYIRAWVDQLGQNLNVGATMTDLIRESSGRFSLQASIDLEHLETLSQQLGTSEFYQHVQSQCYFEALEHCIGGRFFRLDAFEERLMRNGQIAHTLAKRLLPVVKECWLCKKDEVLRIFTNHKGHDSLLALVQISAENPRPKILRVFHEKSNP